jgi:hypothetical protein
MSRDHFRIGSHTDGINARATVGHDVRVEARHVRQCTTT